MQPAGKQPPPPRDLSQDRAWLASFRAGERSAMERVFRTYGNLVMHMVRFGTATVRGSFGRDEEDLVQEVFFRAFEGRARASYDGVRPYPAFLRGVVKNVLMERGRAAQRERSMGILDDQPHALDLWEPGAQLPDELLMAQQAQTLMAQFHTTLSPQERALVKVRFEEGVSQRDAEVQLGLSRQAIRTQEGKLRDKLRIFLKENGAEDHINPS